MNAVASRIFLDLDAAVVDLQRLAPQCRQRWSNVFSPRIKVGKPGSAVERVRRRGETPLGQRRSPDHSCVSLPGLKRLCVRPEVLSRTACLCQRKTNGMSDALGIKS